MGQKTNPNILRLVNIKQWKSKYIEKKSSESPIYIFQDLETKKFIKKLLKDNNIILHNCQTRYLENSLHIYISYYIITTDSLVTIKNKLKEKYIQLKSKRQFLTNKFRRKYFNLKQKTKNYFKYKKIIEKISKKKTSKKNNFLLKHKRNKFINYYKLACTNKQTITDIQSSFFWNKIAKSIQLFLGNSMNVSLHFKQLTKPTISKFTTKQVKILRKIIGQLRKYKQNNFFNEGINLIFTTLTTNQSPILLTTFIADQLKKQKRHNFFFSFIRTTIKLLNQNNLTNPKGIKIKIKGRLNGAPRAKHKIITIGQGVPTLTINSNVNYAESTAFTPNGTFGVKVWTFN